MSSTIGFRLNLWGDGSLVKNAEGSWGPAVKPMSVKTVVECSGKVHGGICHVTMMYGSMNKPP